jgi:hypothetical protein
MKKTLSILAGLSLAISAFGQSSDSLSDLSFSFSTTGPDLYADGTPVLTGETYLLVYIVAGQTFQGIRTDGSLVDPVNNRAVAKAPAVSGSRCDFTVIQYKANAYPAGGKWLVVLLDTRDSFGTVGGLIAGHSAEAVAARKNVSSSSYTPNTLIVPAASGSGLTAGAAPRASTYTVPNATITDIKPNGAAVGLRIKDVVGVASYQIMTTTDLGTKNWKPAIGGDLPAMRRAASVQGPDGVPELPATVTVPESDATRYFRVRQVFAPKTP